MSIGQIMLYGGIAGFAVSVIILIVLLKSFDKKRRKELEKIMKSL